MVKSSGQKTLLGGQVLEHNPDSDQNEDLVKDLRDISSILLEDIISRRERLACAREFADHLPPEFSGRIAKILHSELTVEEKAIEIALIEQSIRSGRC